MTQQNEIHQIEYRWEQQQDLVPIASSMARNATQSWNAFISSWVRHPDAEVTPESVRYQLLPDGRAVLAWRYRDPEAARREDGTRGRPIVSRVFVAQPGLLSPDIAIVLCRAGLPSSAGPRPGEVASGDELPPVRLDELQSLTGDWAKIMDREAALEPGLSQLLAIALAEPGLPLAIQLRLPDICDPPGNGPQPRLLWGMWRIGWPLLGDGGRSWSFSTFEQPLGESDPARLPDIVFRLDQQLQHAPAMSRDERRVSPYGHGTPGALGRYPGMSDWLVEEYGVRGGDELCELLAECGRGAPYHARLDAVYAQLQGERRPQEPASIPEPDPGETSGSGLDGQQYEQRQSREPGPYDPDGQPERYEPAARDGFDGGYEDREETREADYSRGPERQTPAASGYLTRPYRANEYQPVHYEPVTYPQAKPAQGYPPQPWQRPQPGGDPATLQQPRAEPAPALHLPGPQAGPFSDQPPESGPSAGQVRPPQSARRSDSSHHVAKVSELLRSLTAAADAGEFRSALERVHRPPMPFDQSDRRQACREMQGNNWYIPDLLAYNYVPCEHELARIFRVILLDDLSLVQIRRQIAGWIVEAGEREIRPLIRALLRTPQDDDGRKQMRALLRPALAVRLIVHYDCADLWPSEPEPQESDSSGSGTPVFRRIFRGGGRD